MTEDEKLQKLLQLKNYETPGEEYFDQFLDDFKKQRGQESAQMSPFDHFKIRFDEWYQTLGSEKWAVPAGAFATAVMAFFIIGQRGTEEQISVRKASEDVTKPQTIEVQLPRIPNSPEALEGNGNPLVQPAKH